MVNIVVDWLDAKYQLSHQITAQDQILLNVASIKIPKAGTRLHSSSHYSLKKALPVIRLDLPFFFNYFASIKIINKISGV